MPTLIDLGPVKKKGLIDLGPAPTPIMEAIKEVEPLDPNKPIGFVEDTIPPTGIPEIADPQDVSLNLPAARKPTGKVSPVRKKQPIGAMVPFGMPPGAGFGDPLGLSEISTAIREMVAPTTPYTEKEAIQAYKEIPRTLENVGARVLTLGGLAGPLMGLKPSELKAALDEDIRELAGFQPALAPATGETALLAVEWGYLYPKLFKAVGAAPRLIAKIPGVSRGAKALKSLGGIEKIATKYPRLYNRVSKVLGAFGKGATVGTIVSAPEAIGEELPAGEVLKHIGKRAALLGGVAATLQIAGQVDTARYVKQLRSSLIKASNQRFTAKIAEVNAMPKSTAKSAAYKSLNTAKRLELQQIDNIVSAAEAQLIGLKTNKLYQQGQEMVESPQKAAERFIRQGIGAGKPYRGEPLLKKGLGKAKPFIELPTTRAGEVRESLAEAAKAVRHPVKAVRKAVAGRLLTVPKAVTPPPIKAKITPDRVKSVAKKFNISEERARTILEKQVALREPSPTEAKPEAVEVAPEAKAELVAEHKELYRQIAEATKEERPALEARDEKVVESLSQIILEEFDPKAGKLNLSWQIKKSELKVPGYLRTTPKPSEIGGGLRVAMPSARKAGAWQVSTVSVDTVLGKAKPFTHAEFDTKEGALEYLKNIHKNEVRWAIQKGKPIPAEVLAEYPDLKPPTEAKAEVGKEIKTDIAEYLKLKEDFTSMKFNLGSPQAKKLQSLERRLLDVGILKTEETYKAPSDLKEKMLSRIKKAEPAKVVGKKTLAEIKKETPAERKYFTDLLLNERERIIEEAKGYIDQFGPDILVQDFQPRINEIDKDLRRRGYNPTRLPKLGPELKKEIAKGWVPVKAEEVKPKPGAREAGFVDLTPIAEAGEQVAKKAQRAHKVLTRFTGLESQIRKSLIELEEESRRIPRQAAKESIKKYGKLSSFESRAILNHLDNPKKYPDLPAKLKTYAEQVRADQKEVKAIMNELGYGANWPEGRIAYLREKLSQVKSTAKQIEIMEAIDELEGLGYVHHTYKDLSKPRRIIRAMVAKKRISKRPSGLLGRKYPTLEIAEKAGKKVSHLAVAQADMLSIARRAQQNKLLIDAINKNTELALPEKKAPEDWVYLDSRAFPSSQKTVSYTDKEGKAHTRTYRYKYHPAIAEAIEEIAYVSRKHPLTRAYDKVNATLKHILFYNPVVMSKNDLFQAWRATGTGFLWNLPKAAYNVATQTPQYHEYRKAGLYNNVIDFTPAAKHLAENMIDAIRKSKGRRVAEHLAQYINPYNLARDLKWLNDRTTWKMDEVLRTATAQSMTLPRSRWKKMGMTHFEVIELANDFLANYGKVPKRTRQVLNRAIFTPTYKVSMARVLGKMWVSPKKFWPQLARHYAYKMFVWYALPGIVGLWVYGDWKAGRSEKGYKVVLKHPKTGRETVYSLSDPLLEEAKVSQRPILQTLEYNLAAVPNLVLNLLRKPYYRNQRDKFGHLFKLGTPIMKDVYNMTDKDKTTAERILTQLAIAYVYHRKGKPQDNETAISAAARAMSIWTNWREQKTDIERRMGTSKQAGARKTRQEREKRMLRQ